MNSDHEHEKRKKRDNALRYIDGGIVTNSRDGRLIFGFFPELKGISKMEVIL